MSAAIAKEPGLSGLKVVAFESRLAKTMENLIRLQGGTPLSAPSLKEVPLEANAEALAFAERLFESRFGMVIFLTGVGARMLMSILETRYPKEKILEALKKTVLVARGPKPVKALSEFGLTPDLTVPEPNTWRELLKMFDENKRLSLKDLEVAVQEYGVSNEELTKGLEERGARVFRVPVYRWALPEDLGPLQAAIRAVLDREVDLALFTTSIQADHLFRVAAQMGVEKDLKSAFRGVVIASVGPDSSETLRSMGLSVDIEPKTPKMGELVLAAAAEAKKALMTKSGRSVGAPFSVKAESLPGGVLRPEIHESVFLKACRRQKTPYTPVWLMRQAGRYMKDYRQLRERHSFLELCKDKDLAAEITVNAQQKIKADAAIIFSDILVILEPLGLDLEYVKGGGPVIHNPLRAQDVDRLRPVDPQESLRFVFDAIRKTRASLAPGVALLGFAGAPFTLASYMIEGGASKDFSKTRSFMCSNEAAWRRLMEKLVRATADYLNGQIQAGAHAVQVFDTWAGCLGAAEYEKHVLPYSRALIHSLKKEAPVIHFGTATSAFLEIFASAGGDVIGVDHYLPLNEAWERIGYEHAIQGNLDPRVLLGSPVEIRQHVEEILGQAAGRDGHIFNLGHGVLPATPVENVVALVDMVHELSRK